MPEQADTQSAKAAQAAAIARLRIPGWLACIVSP